MDIQINKLNITDHRNDAILWTGDWHVYQGQFDSDNEKGIYFQLWNAGGVQKEKITKESTALEMNISLKNENITLIMVRQ